jgi:molecular chaperone DnaK (HSP70)/5-hydroxyisourate hydrolase-like protein (transthyretin family)
MRALVTAAKLAGINRCSLSTPSALAALAFTKQNHLQLGNGRSFVVFCMGSHYVESSVVRIEQDESCTVLYGAGSSECGGDSLTDVLMDHIRGHLKSNIPTDSKTMLILRRECESIKKSLSASSVAYFHVSSVSDDDSGIFTVQKELFESKCANQFYSAVVSINDVDSFIKDHDLEVNDVIIAGGSTRIPQIQQLLFKTFGRNPNKMLNLDEAVAIGAAYKAAAHDGAASLSEIIHHSIGIKTEDGHITPILRKNENYPAVNEVVFHRSHDSDRHESVIIDVYEGDNADLRGNTSLEKFSCDSLASRIKITLALNDFYELEMIVMDMENDSVILKENNVCMKHFSKDEIEFMTFRNINFANQTRERLKCMEARNQLEEFIIHIKSSNVDDEDLIHHCDEVLEVLGNKDSVLTVDKVELFRVKLQHEFEQHKAAARRANEITVSIRVFDSNQGRCAAGLNVILESHYSRIKDILATGVTDDKGELSLCVPFEKFNQGSSFVRLVVLGIDTYYQSLCGYPSIETIFFLEAVPDCQPQWTITFSLSAFNYNVNMAKRAAS